jgi:cysteinyl-tRNA synthetase
MCRAVHVFHKEDGGAVRHRVPTGSPTALSERKRFVPCDHEYLNFKGSKLSKSRGTALEVPYFLSKYDPHPLRLYLTATASCVLWTT